MDALLSRITQHAVQYAIRSGISITAGFALQHCNRLLKAVPKSRDREELRHLQARLESKIRIISPSIDMIELIAARGNTSLDSALALTREIRSDIQQIGLRLSDAANDSECRSRSRTHDGKDHELKGILSEMDSLIVRLEDAVPLINLAISTSGVNLSTKLSGTISPSRLLQASTFLTAADSSFTTAPDTRHQVGPTYTLSLYMLFAGHAIDPVNHTHTALPIWKEVIHKARVKLWRVPLKQIYALPGEHTTTGSPHDEYLQAESKATEFAYQLVVVEDLDDDRLHTYDDHDAQPGAFDDVPTAGVRDVVPVHEISKIFYADTGKILNLGSDGDTHRPVVLIKRDVHASPPRRMLKLSSSLGALQTTISADAGVHVREEITQPRAHNIATESASLHSSAITDQSTTEVWRLPANLDPEWMALEVYSENDISDSEAESEPEDTPVSRNAEYCTADHHQHIYEPINPSVVIGPVLDKLKLSPGSDTQRAEVVRSDFCIKTSLSLLEMLLRLTALQQFRQESHLAIEDELLNFFLEDSATAGAGLNKASRQRTRQHAVQHIGFDPYDESPMKRRGERHIQSSRGHASPRSRYVSTDPSTTPLEDADSPQGRPVSSPLRDPVNAIPRSGEVSYVPSMSPQQKSYPPTPARTPIPCATLETAVSATASASGTINASSPRGRLPY